MVILASHNRWSVLPPVPLHAGLVRSFVFSPLQCDQATHGYRSFLQACGESRLTLIANVPKKLVWAAVGARPAHPSGSQPCKCTFFFSSTSGGCSTPAKPCERHSVQLFDVSCDPPPPSLMFYDTNPHPPPVLVHERRPPLLSLTRSGRGTPPRRSAP